VANSGGQPIARYYYDPFGRRLWKTLEAGTQGHSGAVGPETAYLAYSDEGYAAEFRLPGMPTTAPTQGPTTFTAVWVYAPEGLWSTDPIAIRTAQGWRYPQSNHLATVQRVIDGEGAITTTMRMNAFGEVRVQGQQLSKRFPGQLHDPETGLSYNYFRSYEPGVGRYVESDPTGLRGGLNIYAYADSNPVVLVDPEGLQIVAPFPRPRPRPVPMPPPDLAPPVPGGGVPHHSSDSGEREWGRPRGRGRYHCVVRCIGVEISGGGDSGGSCSKGNSGNCPNWIYGQGYGFSAAEAWNNAWDAANFNTPRGCHKRHCRGIFGDCKNWTGGKR